MRHTATRAGAIAAAVVLGGVGVAAASPRSDDGAGPAATPAPSMPRTPAATPPSPPSVQSDPPGPLLTPAPGPRLEPDQRRGDDGMPRARPERPGPVRMPQDRPTPPPPVPMPPAQGDNSSGQCPELPSVGPVVCDISPGRTGH